MHICSLNEKKMKGLSSQPITYKPITFTFIINSTHKSKPQIRVSGCTLQFRVDRSLFHQFCDTLCEDTEDPSGMKPCAQYEESLLSFSTGVQCELLSVALQMPHWQSSSTHICLSTHLGPPCLLPLRCTAAVKQGWLLEIGEHT